MKDSCSHTPVSERQQLARIKRISSPSLPGSPDNLQSTTEFLSHRSPLSDITATSAVSANVEARNVVSVGPGQNIASSPSLSAALHLIPCCRSCRNDPLSKTLIKRLLRRNCKGETVLHKAAMKGDVDSVKSLIRMGLSPNVVDNAGYTPLHEACNHGHIDVVRILIKNGADVNAEGGEDGITPLHDASYNGHDHIVNFLALNAADCESEDRLDDNVDESSILHLCKFVGFINPSSEILTTATRLVDHRTLLTVERRLRQTSVRRNIFPPADSMSSMKEDGQESMALSEDKSKVESDIISQPPVSGDVERVVAVASVVDKSETGNDAHVDHMKVPPLKISLPSHTTEGESDESTIVSPATSSEAGTGDKCTGRANAQFVDNSAVAESKSTPADENTSHASPAVSSSATSSDDSSPSVSNCYHVKKRKLRSAIAAAAAAFAAASSQDGGANDNTTTSSTSATTGTGSSESASTCASDNHSETESSKDTSMPSTTSACFLATTAEPRNDIEKFIKLRRQIEQRWKNIFPVQPKPPEGFEDYLMNRKTYLLAGRGEITQQRLRAIGRMQPPPALIELGGHLLETFVRQESERFRMRKVHTVQREKLVLCVEQEILRVHGRAARALANQSLPFSFCSYIRDDNVYSTSPGRPAGLAAGCSLIGAGNGVGGSCNTLLGSSSSGTSSLLGSSDVSGGGSSSLIGGPMMESQQMHTRGSSRHRHDNHLQHDEQNRINRDIRSRYNGRLFLSWLQDVDDKWEKIKEEMVQRHHIEATTLAAMQKADWQWAADDVLDEDQTLTHNQRSIVKSFGQDCARYVPTVHVSDEFDIA